MSTVIVDCFVYSKAMFNVMPIVINCYQTPHTTLSVNSTDKVRALSVNVFHSKVYVDWLL